MMEQRTDMLSKIRSQQAGVSSDSTQIIINFLFSVGFFSADLIYIINDTCILINDDLEVSVLKKVVLQFGWNIMLCF